MAHIAPKHRQRDDCQRGRGCCCFDHLRQNRFGLLGSGFKGLGKEEREEREREGQREVEREREGKRERERESERERETGVGPRWKAVTLRD